MRDRSPVSFLMMIARTPYFGILLLSLGFVTGLLCYVNTDYVWLTGMSNTLNDQVAYISTARALVDTFELRSSIVYPSLLTQESGVNYPYMPGHYFALAASYLVWGYSPLASFLPNLLGYVLSACCLLVIAIKLHDRTTGYLASFIFLTFPACLSYGCTAMAELTFVAAGMLAFALFLFVPVHQRPYAGPILLLLPVLFRETGALFVIPMVAVMLNDRSQSSRRDTLILIVLSVVLVSLLVFGIFGDRPSFMKLNLADASVSQKYMNAFSESEIGLSPSQLPDAILDRISANWTQLTNPRTHITRFESFSLWFILLAMPLGFVLGILERGRLILAYSLMSAGVWMLLLATYSVWGHVGLRNMLFCLPFAAIVYAKTMIAFCPDRHQRKLLVGTLIVGMIVGGIGVRTRFGAQDDWYRFEAGLTTFLERLDHDDNLLLVSPLWSLPFAVTHYPVEWSFIPANLKTLRLLDQKFEIGSLLLSFDRELTTLTHREIEGEGFIRVRAYRLPGNTLFLYKKRPTPR